ncbi:MAG: AAA family ATPase [Candidatus Kariarchaeaceae archaeon]|jgi:hypothetical protein
MRADLNQWITENKPNKSNALPSKVIFIKGVTDLNDIWRNEVASKRLYSKTKYNGNTLIKMQLTGTATLIIDDDAKFRQPTFNQLWPDRSFGGETWSSMSAHLLAYHFKLAKTASPVSTPNAYVLSKLGTRSIAGFTYRNDIDVSEFKSNVYGIDARRQYTSILRQGNFYTVDFTDEIMPITKLSDWMDKFGNVLNDRIYVVSTPPSSYARLLLGQGLCDYELVSAYREQLPQSSKSWLDFPSMLVGYLKVTHRPECDNVYRNFIDDVYTRVTNDSARKRLPNFAIGLLASGRGRTRQHVHHTDNLEEAHFYYNTSNANNCTLSKQASYVNDNGIDTPVYTVRGITSTKRLSTQILQHRCIVQRGRAQMIRAMTKVKDNGGIVISVHIDSMTYISDKPIFDTPESPGFGQWRKHKPVLDLKVTAINEFEIENKLWDGYSSEHKDIVEDIICSTMWNSEKYDIASPSDIIGGLMPKVRQKRLSVREQKRLHEKEIEQQHDPDYVWDQVCKQIEEIERQIAIEEGTYVEPEEKDYGKAYNRCAILGNSGTGKTHLANMLAEELKSRGFNMVARCAFTLVASELVSGRTLHSLLGICIGKGSTSSKIAQVLNTYDAIIIDEISMIPPVIWRVLSYIPLDFPMFLFGDFDQKKPVGVEFDGRNLQAIKTICNNRKIILTKQWRSDTKFVQQCKNHGKSFDTGKPTKLPYGIRDGSQLSIEQLSQSLNIFKHNRPRAALNCKIVSHMAQRIDGSVTIPLSDRSIVADNTHYEHPDMDQLFAIMNDQSTSSDEVHKLRAYLSRARMIKGKWTVGVKYNRSDCGRYYANNSIQGFSKETRSRACRKFTDLDFVNCGPTILSQMMKKIGVPCAFLDEYVANRNKYLKEVIKAPRDITFRGPSVYDTASSKNEFVRVMNGGRPSKRHKILTGIVEDIKRLWDYVAQSQKYKVFVGDIIKKNCKYDNIKDPDAHLRTMKNNALADTYIKHRRKYDVEYAIANHVYTASYVSHRVYTIESLLLAELVSIVVKQVKGRNVSKSAVLVFDGAMFYDIDASKIDRPKIASALFASTGYKMKIAIKPNSDGTPLPVVPKFNGYMAPACTRNKRDRHGKIIEGKLCSCLNIQFDEYPAIYKDLGVIMTHTRKMDGHRFTNNERFTVVDIDSSTKTVKLSKVSANSTHTLSWEELAKYSRPSYCRTDYKVQGLTASDNVVVHQYWVKHGSKYLVEGDSRYVALTRAKSRHNVYVC